jgi:hypothetical protein
MLIQIETKEEERILRERFRAVAHTLGPMVDLRAVFPDGSTLRTLKGGRSSAAQARSIVERLTS